MFEEERKESRINGLKEAISVLEIKINAHWFLSEETYSELKKKKLELEKELKELEDEVKHQSM